MAALVCLILAAICFAADFFHRDLDGHSLIAAGLFLVAIALILGNTIVASRVARRVP